MGSPAAGAGRRQLAPGCGQGQQAERRRLSLRRGAAAGGTEHAVPALGDVAQQRLEGRAQMRLVQHDQGVRAQEAGVVGPHSA